MDLVGGHIARGAEPSVLFGPVCCLAQCFVLYSVLLGNVLLGNVLRIIF